MIHIKKWQKNIIFDEIFFFARWTNDALREKNTVIEMVYLLQRWFYLWDKNEAARLRAMQWYIGLVQLKNNQQSKGYCGIEEHMAK